MSTGRAPELPQLDAAHWLNSPPLKLAALRGRPVLIEFWAFGCSNCRNTLPWLERTHARYASKWPAFYLIDTAGRIIDTRIGELHAGERRADTFEAASAGVLQARGAEAATGSSSDPTAAR